MEVILLEDVYKHGVAGEVVKVADGFARNYLIPHNLAVKATKGEMKRVAKLREQVEARRAAYKNKLNDLAQIIDGVELIFGRRAAHTGKLFGSVTTQEIAEELMEKIGVDLNRRRISQQPLREVGMHEVPVRLGTEISPILQITIVPQDELAEFLAAREAGEDPEIGVEGEAVDEVEAYVEAESADEVEAYVEAQSADEVEAYVEAQSADEGDDEDEAEPGDAEMATEIMPRSVVEEALAAKAAEVAAESEDENGDADADEDGEDDD